MRLRPRRSDAHQRARHEELLFVSLPPRRARAPRSIETSRGQRDTSPMSPLACHTVQVGTMMRKRAQLAGRIFLQLPRPMGRRPRRGVGGRIGQTKVSNHGPSLMSCRVVAGGVGAWMCFPSDVCLVECLLSATRGLFSQPATPTSPATRLRERRQSDADRLTRRSLLGARRAGNRQIEVAQAGGSDRCRLVIPTLWCGHVTCAQRVWVS